MSQAVLVKIAEAITTEIAGAKFGGVKLKPVRSYADWDEKLEEVTDTLCDVVPIGHRESRLEDRGSVGYVCETHVGIRAKPGNIRKTNGQIDAKKIDKYVLLLEQIHEFFCRAGNGRRLADYEEAVWVETKIDLSYSRQMLRDNGQYLGLIRLTYEANV